MIYNVEPQSKHTFLNMLKDTVSLDTALQNAHGGDVINIAPGEYELADPVVLNGDRMKGIVPDDQYYLAAFENTNQKEIPTDPIILCGDLKNSDNVLIKGQITLNNCTLCLEGMTYYPKYADNSGITLKNKANLVSNGVQFLSYSNSEKVNVYCDVDTTITCIATNISSGPDNVTNITIGGKGYFDNCDVQSGLYLKGDSKVKATHCEFNWINLFDKANFVGRNSFYHNVDDFIIKDRSYFDCSNSTIEIGKGWFAEVNDQGQLVGQNLSFRLNGYSPEIHVSGGSSRVNVTSTEKIYYYLGNNALFTFTDKGRKITVNNSDELKDALDNGHSGDEVWLAPGEYEWLSEYNILPNNYSINGLDVDPTKTILKLNKEIGIQEKAKVTITNLTLQKVDPKINLSLIYTRNLGSVVIVKNCILNHEDSDVVAISSKRDSKIELINCGRIVSKKGILDVRANEDSKITITNSMVDEVLLFDNAEINFSNSKLTSLISIENNSKIELEKSTFTFDKNMKDNNLSVNASNSAQLIFKECNFENTNKKIKFLLSDNAKVQFDLAKYDNNSPIEIDAPDVNTQVINPKGYVFTSAKKKSMHVDAQNAASMPPKSLSLDIDTNPESVQAYQELMGLIGLKKVKSQIETFIKTAIFNEKRKAAGLKATGMTLHSSFIGNPGTGKTTVARLVGNILYGYGILKKPDVLDVSRSDLVANYTGQTANKTHKILEKANGGVLLIDEAYTLYNEASIDYGREALDEILKYMEDHRNEIMIIFTGYPKEMQNLFKMNPGLKSRVPNTFVFEDYTPDEIAQIGLSQLNNDDYKLGNNTEMYQELVKTAYIAADDKSNARWIRNVNQKLTNQLGNDNISGKNDSLDTFTSEEIHMILDPLTNLE